MLIVYHPIDFCVIHSQNATTASHQLATTTNKRRLRTQQKIRKLLLNCWLQTAHDKFYGRRSTPWQYKIVKPMIQNNPSTLKTKGRPPVLDPRTLNICTACLSSTPSGSVYSLIRREPLSHRLSGTDPSTSLQGALPRRASVKLASLFGKIGFKLHRSDKLLTATSKTVHCPVTVGLDSNRSQPSALARTTNRTAGETRTLHNQQLALYKFYVIA